MLSPKLTRYIAGGAAVLALAVGGVTIANSSSGTGTSGTATAAQAPAAGPHQGFGPRGAGPAPGAGQASPPIAKSGQLPPNWTPGSGTIVTGAAADKAKAVALAKYPGTVNRVLQLSDGSYAVHMFATTGPHHVFVSKDFKITGTA